MQKLLNIIKNNKTNQNVTTGMANANLQFGNREAYASLKLLLPLTLTLKTKPNLP